MSLSPSSICFFPPCRFRSTNQERPCIASAVPDFQNCPLTSLTAPVFYLQKRKERRPATPPAKLSLYWQLGNGKVLPPGVQLHSHSQLVQYDLHTCLLLPRPTGCLSANLGSSLQDASLDNLLDSLEVRAACRRCSNYEAAWADILMHRPATARVV